MTSSSPEPDIGRLVDPDAPPPGWQVERLTGWKEEAPEAACWRVVRWRRDVLGYTVLVAPFRG